jgi:hypothetical protein
LRDDEIRHALRDCLLSPFAETLSTIPTNTCSSCGVTTPFLTTAKHFVACTGNHAHQTTRHYAFRAALRLKFGEGLHVTTHKETAVGEYIGDDGVSHEARSDINFVHDGVERHYDVGITSVHQECVIEWPTDIEVSDAVERDANDESDTIQPIWDVPDRGHHDDITHPDVIRNVKFRQLAWVKGVLPVLSDMENAKRRHYARATHSSGIHVIPLILSDRGSMSDKTRASLQHLVYTSNPADVRERAIFRRRLFGRLSVVLIKYARFMARDQSEFMFSRLHFGN